mgnify:CR=1 FL=1
MKYPCEEKLVFGKEVVFCVKEQGHEGLHMSYDKYGVFYWDYHDHGD